MRIEIEIPKEFENDYKVDMFKDFFSRVLCDIEKGKCLCGNYEKETAEMFLKAFDESKIAFDTEKVVEQLEEMKSLSEDAVDYEKRHGNIEDRLIAESSLKELNRVIDIVKKGGVE